MKTKDIVRAIDDVMAAREAELRRDVPDPDVLRVLKVALDALLDASYRTWRREEKGRAA